MTNNSDYIQRGFYKGPAATGETVDILCDYPTIARYVRLRITVGSGNSLHIQELEIYTIWLGFYEYTRAVRTVRGNSDLRKNMYFEGWYMFYQMTIYWK